MKKRNMAGFFSMLTVCMAVFFLSGCAGIETAGETAVPADPEIKFQATLDGLINGILEKQKSTAHEFSPVAVMPGAVRSGRALTRLDEKIIEGLILRLRKDHEVIALSRWNWFEFREGKPLSCKNRLGRDRAFFDDLVVFEVSTSPDDSLNEGRVQIAACDVRGRGIPGMVKSSAFDFSPNAPARRLFSLPTLDNPYPEGLEENPYRSIDRLAYSLASELTDAYLGGMKAGAQVARSEEVRVSVFTKKTFPPTAEGLLRTIEESIQQALVSTPGFTCAVSPDDFGALFEHLGFYGKNKGLFEIEETLFARATVLLLMEVMPHPAGDKLGVSIRAVWRVGPLESAEGELVSTNLAGTYLSGFASKAYLATGGPFQGGLKSADGFSSGNEEALGDGLARAYEVCFYLFTDAWQDRIREILKESSRVVEVRRIDCPPGDNGISMCYSLFFRGDGEEFISWLGQNLRTSPIKGFRIIRSGVNRLQIHFDAGFSENRSVVFCRSVG